jgi:predicted transcriptional regulator
MVTNNVINFRCSPDVADRLDELATSENRSRSNVLDTLLKRVLNREAISWPIEQLVEQIRRDDETFPYASQSKYGDFYRGQLHGAKWMLETILGRHMKDRILHDVRQKTGPIPHSAPRNEDGSHIGFDSDAW